MVFISQKNTANFKQGALDKQTAEIGNKFKTTKNNKLGEGEKVSDYFSTNVIKDDSGKNKMGIITSKSTAKGDSNDPDFAWNMRKNIKDPKLQKAIENYEKKCGYDKDGRSIAQKRISKFSNEASKPNNKQSLTEHYKNGIKEKGLRPNILQGVNEGCENSYSDNVQLNSLQEGENLLIPFTQNDDGSFKINEDMIISAESTQGIKAPKPYHGKTEGYHGHMFVYNNPNIIVNGKKLEGPTTTMVMLSDSKVFRKKPKGGGSQGAQFEVRLNSTEMPDGSYKISIKKTEYLHNSKNKNIKEYSGKNAIEDFKKDNPNIPLREEAENIVGAHIKDKQATMKSYNNIFDSKSAGFLCKSLEISPKNTKTDEVFLAGADGLLHKGGKEIASNHDSNVLEIKDNRGNFNFDE